MRGAISFPRRFVERVTRAAEVTADRIGRMTVEEVRRLQCSVNDRRPALPVRVLLTYDAGAFRSIRYVPSRKQDGELLCWIGNFGEPDRIVDDLVHAARVEHVWRMIIHRHGSDPMPTASDQEVAEALGPPTYSRNAEEAAWCRVAGREARLRYRESAHRQLRRRAAISLRDRRL